jgi:catecholate siderophore receptor
VPSRPSYRAALTYKPVSNGRIYFAYGTSFNPSAEGLSLAANTADLAPEKNESFELGTKWDILHEKLSVTSSIFQIEKMNARVPDPNNSAFNVLGGDQRVRGFEVGVAGSITDSWQIYAGYAYLDSKVVKSSVAASLGVPLANTPQNTFSL